MADVSLEKFECLDALQGPKIEVAENDSRFLDLSNPDLLDPSKTLQINVQKNASLIVLSQSIGQQSLERSIDLNVAEGGSIQWSRIVIGCKQFSENLNFVLSKQATFDLSEYFSESGEVQTTTTGKLCGRDSLYKVRSLSNLQSGRCHHHGKIQHLSGDNKSDQHHRFILENNSKGKYLGEIHIAEKCPGVGAKQLNHNLVLDEGSRMETSPSLEIFTDDVKCAHGATIARSNPQQQFYLQSRGIKPQLAHKLLLKSFAEEIMQQFPSYALETLLAEGR